MKTKTIESLMIISLGLALVVILCGLIPTVQQTASVCESGGIAPITATPTRTPRPTFTPMDLSYDPQITAVHRYIPFSGTVQPYIEVMPSGQIIDVRERVACEDTDIYGGPRDDAIVMGHLKKGDSIVSHEIYKGWVMFKAARWVPESALCP